MTIRSTLLFIHGMLAFHTHAQTPGLAWEKFFDGSLSGRDEANDLLVMPDNSVYVTGAAQHEVQQGTMTTLRYSPVGDLLMQDHVYGPSQQVGNIGEALTMDSAGFVYAAGLYGANSGDLGLVKYGPSGRLWRSNYEAYWFGSDLDHAYDVAVAPDGSVYMAASITSLSGMLLDNFILKTDSAGEQLWTAQAAISSADERAECVAVTPSGTAFIAGLWWNTQSNDGLDLAVARFAPDGTPVWDRAFQAPGFDDRAEDLVVTADEHSIVCGAVGTASGTDMFVMERDDMGAEVWHYQFDGGGGNDTAIALIAFADGRVAVTGNAMIGIIPTIVTMVLEQDQTVWIEEHAGEAGLGAWATDMAVGANGQLLICGSELVEGGSATDGLLLKYNSADGDLAWHIAHDAGSLDRFNAVGANSTGDVIATGSSGDGSGSRYMTVQYGNAVGIDDRSSVPPIRVWPSPAVTGSSVFITAPESGSMYCQIFDPSGREVLSGRSSGTITWKPTTPGCYTILLRTAEGMFSARSIVH